MSKIINSFYVAIIFQNSEGVVIAQQCWLGAESCMANPLLFEKEDNFCMTFLVGHWPATP